MRPVTLARTTAPVIALLMLTLFPSISLAAPEVVDRQIQQTTGAEMALGMVAGLQGVDVDSTGLTIKVEQAGELRPVRVDLSGILEGTQGSSNQGVLRLGTIAVVVGLFLRAVRTLTRLGNSES